MKVFIRHSSSMPTFYCEQEPFPPSLPGLSPRPGESSRPAYPDCTGFRHRDAICATGIGGGIPVRREADVTATVQRGRTQTHQLAFRAVRQTAHDDRGIARLLFVDERDQHCVALLRRVGGEI